MKIDPATLPVLSNENVRLADQQFEYERVSMAKFKPLFGEAHRIETAFPFMTPGDFDAMCEGKPDYGHVAPGGSIVYWDQELGRIYSIIVIKDGRRYVYDLSST